MDHMEVGNMLACLENNFNTNRGQKTTLRRDATGTVKIKSHFRVAYRKPKKQFIARKFYNPKKYEYMKEMKEEARKNARIMNKFSEKSKLKRMAPVERNRNELISKSLK